MNATDVLDAYLDQHCKRSFQSSKSMLRGRPPRHGGRNKASRSSPKHVKSSDAGPLSPFSSPARRSKDANPATPRDTKYLQTSKQHSSKAAINPLHKTPQRSASVPTPGQQQTASKPSASLTQHKEAYRRWQKAEVRHSSSLPVLSGAAHHARASSLPPCFYPAPPPLFGLSLAGDTVQLGAGPCRYWNRRPTQAVSHTCSLACIPNYMWSFCTTCNTVLADSHFKPTPAYLHVASATGFQLSHAVHVLLNIFHECMMQAAAPQGASWRSQSALGQSQTFPSPPLPTPKPCAPPRHQPDTVPSHTPQQSPRDQACQQALLHFSQAAAAAQLVFWDPFHLSSTGAATASADSCQAATPGQLPLCWALHCSLTKQVPELQPLCPPLACPTRYGHAAWSCCAPLSWTVMLCHAVPCCAMLCQGKRWPCSVVMHFWTKGLGYKA